MRLFLSFRQYAATVFIVNNRFEMGKKKLAYLTFDDLVHCANEMIATWSNSSKGKWSVLIQKCNFSLNMIFLKLRHVRHGSGAR